MALRSILVGAVALGAGTLVAQSAAVDGRPKYQLLRQNEDWSGFRAGADSGLLDQLKHVGDGDVWASFGGRFHTRMESWDGFGFGATNPGNSDTFLLTHLFLHGDLHLGSRVRAYVEAYGADVWGRNDLSGGPANNPGGRRTLDTNSPDLFQGFVDVDLLDGEDELRLRVGRQTLLFGAQRVVSPLPWANTWRTWDGVSAELRTGEWTVTGFATYYVPVQKRDFDDSDDSQEFYGMHASQPANKEHRGLDVYLLGKSRDNVSAAGAKSGATNGTTGNERRHTIGARSYGSLGGAWDGELEGAYQFGEVGTGDVSAWFVSSVLGYKLPDCPLQSRWFLGFDVASGDHRAGGNVTTFDQVFPLGHAYFGYADMVARQNVIALNLGAQLQLTDKTKATVAGHVFRLYDDNDALYSVGGTVARTGLSNKDVGQEIDLFVTHDWSPQLQTYAGYSHVFAGGGLAASGPSEDVDFFYLALTARF